jgi:hypothetical protein
MYNHLTGFAASDSNHGVANRYAQPNGDDHIYASEHDHKY